jgi:AcrR family transcriptional regulator
MGIAEPSTRNRLMQAAGVAFARVGYEAASIRSLTERARTNIGAINFHFGSKQALYEAVLASKLRSIPPAMRCLGGQEKAAAPVENLVSMLTCLFDLLRADPDTASLLFQELAGPRLPSKITREVVREILHDLTELVAMGQAGGVVRGGSPALLGMSAFSQPIFFALAERNLTPDLPWHEADHQAIPMVVDHMERYVRAALVP